jgi:ABC-2 type transport system permease protein
MAMGNPGAGWVTILSMLPPSAPVIMPLRASLVNVPARQVAAAVVLMLGGIYAMLRIGARLYRNAVLHTGARLRLREAWHGEAGRPQPARH